MTGKVYRRFLKIRGRPREIALGFALGIFIGFTPTMGIQVVLAVLAASLLKWSKITAAAGVQITNPVTAPFIYGVTYHLGAGILGIEKPFKPESLLSLDGLMEMAGQAPRILSALTLGGVLVGLPAAAIGYIIVFRIMSRYQETVKTGIRNRAGKIRHRLERIRFGRKRREKKEWR